MDRERKEATMRHRSRTTLHVSSSIPTLRASAGLCPVLIAFGLALAGPRVVSAAPIRFEYGGVITEADPATGVSPGARFTGAFSYDPTQISLNMNIEGYA